MRQPVRGLGSTTRNRRIAGGLLAAAVAAGTAYSVPSPAQAGPPPVQATDSGGNLAPRLSALVAGDQGRPSAAAGGPQLVEPTSGPGTLLRTPDGTRVVVDLRLASPDSSVIQAVMAAGAEVLSDPADYGRVAVSVRPQDLTAVSDVAGVEYVSEELTPQVNAVCDTTKSEGDGILHADSLRGTGVDGAGVKVGVISDSYAKASAPITTASQDIASDNLPGAANTCGHTSVSTVADKPTAGTDEGRAMMQIVHDLAPGSPLDFATAFISEPSFAANIGVLVSQGAKVIVDDVTYFDEPMYQDGIVEQAVTAARAQGVDYFTSSANNRYVKNGHEVGSYEAVNGYRPTPCPAIIPAGHVDCHNFSGGGSDSTFGFNYSSGQTIRPILNWAQPWDGGVTTDLDLYLIDESTNSVVGTGGSQVNNITSQQAVELFGGTLASNDNLALVVARKAVGATPRFKMVFAGNGATPFNTLEREVPDAGTGDVMGPNAFGHNGGADAMSVGASDVRVATNLNSYSSYGPVTTLFGPVNGSTPAAPLASPRVVAKPDLVASDCNRNTFFGSGSPPHFCGTSSAAPHAAAVAALLRQQFPLATTEAINSAMASTATPIAGVSGSFQGAGLLNACAAASAMGATCSPAMPTVTGTDPASGNASTVPKVKGIADAGSTVRIYSTADCSGAPVASGTAAAFAAPGIQVSVATGSTSTLRAKASYSAAGSACSTTSVTYTQVPPTPGTTLVKTPKKTIKTTKRKVRVSFSFASTVAGSTFTCSIDGKAFAACTSGVTYKLKPGKHTFAVRATASGVTDPTPATYSFKIKKKRRR